LTYHRVGEFQICERNGPCIVEIEYFPLLRVIRRAVFYSPPHIPVGLPGLRKVRVDSGDSGWIPGIPGGFRWNVEELHIKEYESGNSRNSGWILG